MRRVEVVTECAECGHVAGAFLHDDECGGPGGSRVVLDRPTDEMVLAAAKSYHAEVGRRSGVKLAWETSYDSEQADFFRVTKAAMDAAWAVLVAQEDDK